MEISWDIFTSTGGCVYILFLGTQGQGKAKQLKS